MCDNINACIHSFINSSLNDSCTFELDMASFFDIFNVTVDTLVHSNPAVVIDFDATHSVFALLELLDTQDVSSVPLFTTEASLNVDESNTSIKKYIAIISTMDIATYILKSYMNEVSIYDALQKSATTIVGLASESSLGITISAVHSSMLLSDIIEQMSQGRAVVKW